MFCVPAWQTAGFTTVSSIESLSGAVRRGAEQPGEIKGIIGRKRRAVFLSLSRGFTSAMTGAPRNRLRIKVFLRKFFFTNPFNLRTDGTYARAY